MDDGYLYYIQRQDTRAPIPLRTLSLTEQPGAAAGILVRLKQKQKTEVACNLPPVEGEGGSSLPQLNHNP